jgi:prepilin-type processing-associated H-X9-DG protein
MVIIAIAHTKKGGGFFSRLIIAILAAILFPVFAKAREKARQTQCLNNQKQIATAVLMYAQDHDEMLPAWGTIWGDISLDKGALICPTAGTKVPIGYIYNSAVAAKALGEITDPTSAWISADGALSANATSVKLSDFAMRHTGKPIASFADGHVELSMWPDWATKTAAWFVAGTGVRSFLGFSDPVMTVTGSNVTAWSSSFGSAVTLTCPAPSTLGNGTSSVTGDTTFTSSFCNGPRKAVHFANNGNTSSYLLYNGTVLDPLRSTYTILAVVSGATSGWWDTVCGCGGRGKYELQNTQISGGSYSFAAAYGSAANVASVVAWVQDGTRLTQFKNGVALSGASVAFAPSAANASATVFAVGGTAQTGNENHMNNGDIAEVVVINRDLSTSELVTASKFLGASYGVNIP